MDIVTLGAALNGSKAYTDQVTQSLMGGVHYRGSVSYYSDLPNDAEEGDSYTVKYAGTSGTVADGTEYTWGYDTDLQNFAWISFSKDTYSKAEIDNKLVGSNIALTGYAKGTTAKQDVSPTDNVNQGLGKIEKRVSDNENNILSNSDAIVDLQAQINEIVTPVTQDAEVQNARIDNNGLTYPSLKGRLSAKDNITDVLCNSFNEEYENITYTFTTGEYIAPNGTITTAATNFGCTNYIDVSDIKVVKIGSKMGYGNGYYAFYDNNNAFICGKFASQSLQIISETVAIPPSAKYMVVGSSSEVFLFLKKIVGYEQDKIWRNKKWVCVGDSLTEVNSTSSKKYYDYIIDDTGISVVNMGVSGTGYKREEANNKAFYQRVSSIPTDADVVTIFGSGNDLALIADLGTPTDTGTTTICGCINTTIDTIISIIPTVKLGIVAPTPWINNQPTLDNSNTMGRYCEALRQICYIRSIPYLDLYHCSNLRPWTQEGREACYSKDDGNGVHPDENGHKLIAGRFKVFVDSLLA